MNAAHATCRAWLFEGDGAMRETAPGIREGNVVYFADHHSGDPAARETALQWQLVAERISTYIAAGTLHAAHIEAIDKLARAMADVVPLLPPKRDD